ncbi:uncharacterized protein LOC106718980 [Papilio machaon]|uniref:uncharacterized protein LOC106718980 n=1 Tax=Papilio machaon TaxID=76193 RepID=UPI001E66564E|nr:uncharacterized protein LOC106718980 [Papilio machaon]
MTLRTPRRRISPRTRRRYRAIRDFLRRALGTASQGTKTNSNVTINASDLKQKISVEQQVAQVKGRSSHLPPPAPSPPNATDYGAQCRQLLYTNQNEQIKASLEKIKINPNETKVLYKTSENQYKNFIESDVTSKVSDTFNVDVNLQKEINKIASKVEGIAAKNKHVVKRHGNKLEAINKIDSNLVSRKKPLSYSSTSNRSSVDLVKADDARCHDKRRAKLNYTNPIILKDSHKYKEDDRKNNIEYLVRKYEERMKRKKYKQPKKEIDKDFIEDIIRRQYKPVNLFSKRESGWSQLSAPLCRDEEFSVEEDIQEGSELCSCCYDKPGFRNGMRCAPSYSDVRSICDTKLYSSKRYPRNRQSKKHQEYYNDSLYDMIPVKEKSSPKSRKKFAEYNMIPYEHYKEVPPSPTSQRPRLNLTAQRHDRCDDYGLRAARPHTRPSVHKAKVQKVDKNIQNDDLTDFIHLRNEKDFSQASTKQGTRSFESDDELNTSVPCHSVDHTRPNGSVHNLSINKTQETGVAVDNTDKALYEIKDILQNFLEEMKKETMHSDKSETSEKSLTKSKHEEEKTNASVLPNTSEMSHNTINPPKPYIPTFPNSCCYPMVPICPIGCVQNGFVIPAQSHTCSVCTNHLKESSALSKDATFSGDTRETRDKGPHDETQQLIKEIYNFVKQAPQPKTNAEYREVSIDNTNVTEKTPHLSKLLTSRSAGNSSKPSAHDAKVGTSQMKCYSKSCEAFGSKGTEDSVYSNTSYSDTILEKLSLEAAATQPDSDFDFSSILNLEVKPRKKKFAKVLQSFGNLLKKRKKEVIQELSESVSTVELDMKPKSPYRQHVTNYMMHREEYYHPPPIPPNYHYHTSPEHSYRAPVGLESRLTYLASPYASAVQEQGMRHGSYPMTSSYSTSMEHPYHQVPSQVPPQVPLCLKEIEVKSIGTQSEKKSFMKILKSRLAVPKHIAVQDPIEEAHKNVSGITKRPGLMNWKNLNEKPLHTRNANVGISVKKTRDELRHTDMTIRNTLIKRFFYKRNPFSPQNPLLQTLLGKDKPMEEPRNLLRTKMIL